MSFGQGRHRWSNITDQSVSFCFSGVDFNVVCLLLGNTERQELKSFVPSK